MMEDNKLLIDQLAESFTTSSSTLFLVEIVVTPKHNIFVYFDDDEGLKIETCMKISRQMKKAIIEQEIFEEGDFSLEVSSPGLDRPLIKHRQYLKNIGRLVEIKKENSEILEGRIKIVTDNEITLEVKEKKLSKEILIPFVEIKEAKILIEFK